MRKFFNAVVLLLLSFMVSACGFEVVDTGHRGVLTRFGEVDLEKGPLPEGLHFYNPITESIKEMEVRTRVYKAETNTYTKDVQQADITYAVNYNLDPAISHTMFRDVGYEWEKTILLPVLEGTFKQVIGQWDAVDLISNRGKATEAVLRTVRTALKDRGVSVSSIEMVNIQYQKDFEQAVEKKVRAIQAAIEEQNRTKQIEEQAKQKVIDAKAQAESMRIRANALQQNAKLVEYEAVQRWDGKLPQYSLGNSTPFIQLNK